MNDVNFKIDKIKIAHQKIKFYKEKKLEGLYEGKDLDDISVRTADVHAKKTRE
jgi:hypothetical protein